jgi:isoleucyl-tRNA synthetase
VYLTTHTALVTVALLMAPIAPFLSEEIYLNLTSTVDQFGKAFGGDASVHLADFPVADEAAKDADLEERMELVRDLVSLGRGVREKERLKVRQPLRAVYADGALEGRIGPMTDLIKDELNVKEVIFLKDTSAYLDYQIKPNFKAAGPVFGKNMKDFAAALASMPPAEAAGLAAAFSGDGNDSARNGGSATAGNDGSGTAGNDRGSESAKEIVTVLVTVGGRDVPVSAELVDIKVSAKEGFAVAMEHGNFIIVDTSLDAELIQEGLAREFVSKVQQMRKAAGLEMMDRIEIFYSGDADVAAAVSDVAHGAYIARETLADRVAEDVDAAAKAADTFDLNGHETKITIRKVV